MYTQTLVVLHTRTHTHTHHTHTHMVHGCCMHTHIQTYTYMHMNVLACMHTQCLTIHRHTRTHTHTHKQCLAGALAQEVPGCYTAMQVNISLGVFLNCYKHNLASSEAVSISGILYTMCYESVLTETSCLSSLKYNTPSLLKQVFQDFAYITNNSVQVEISCHLLYLHAHRNFTSKGRRFYMHARMQHKTKARQVYKIGSRNTARLSERIRATDRRASKRLTSTHMAVQCQHYHKPMRRCNLS